MEKYFIVIFGLHLPSMAIYYFTNGDWPLAFELQTNYFILLTTLFIILFFYWKIQYGPKSLRADNIAVDVFVLILAIIIFLLTIAPIGAISLFYQDLPIGEPGMFKPYIKWGLISFLSITILAVSYFTIIKMRKRRKYNKL